MNYGTGKTTFYNFLNSRFTSDWSKYNILITLIRLISYYVNGLSHRLFFKSSGGHVLTGRGVSIRYGRQLTAGRDFIVEDYAEINCLSKKGIVFGDRVTVGKFAIIRPSNVYGGAMGEGLSVGNNSNIGPFAYIGCSGFIEIGNNVMMGPRVGIYAENHNFENLASTIKEQGVKVEFVKIEDDCWIASNVTILAGVTIGRGSVIGAGSVVTKDVPPFSVVAGVPAKVIKLRGASK